MWSRKVFYVHVFIVAMGTVMGLSESYHWLAWAQCLAVLMIPMMLGNIAIPFVLLVQARKEKRSASQTVAIVVLSTVLSIAWYFAILPLCT
jgi:hypothetical protein